ncbi:NAD-dependent epimerase/dehydratase family protein [candidate division KSB1 bacterium]|nr:NAD-dependent epimerase/dehydratase family protein [Candidatus Aminicenantes bacterium]RQW03658.1 MAG: NAD-dependent epimerase/dehydratase family protein [candidate division KSB1 bacterium]
MLAFVTGASGFIASHLLRALIIKGWDVRALVHNTALDEIPSIESVAGDIRDGTTLENALAGVDAVFHLAAAVGSIVTDSHAFHKVNVDGTQALLAAAQRVGVKRVVHFSSIGVLGAVKTGETAEEDYPPAPRTIYDKTKLAAEKAAGFAAANGLDVVIIRPGWVYGPGDRRTFKFISAICRKKFALIAGAPGRQTPVYIDDLVAGILLVAAKGRPGAIYHLAGDEILTAEEMARTVAAACGVTIPRFKLPKGPTIAAAFILEKVFALAKKETFLNRGKLSFFLDPKAMSSDRAKDELGFAPVIDFRTGIARTVGWYRENAWL